MSTPQPSRALIERVLRALGFRRLQGVECGGCEQHGDWSHETRGELIDDDALDHPAMLPALVAYAVGLCEAAEHHLTYARTSIGLYGFVTDYGDIMRREGETFLRRVGITPEEWEKTR